MSLTGAATATTTADAIGQLTASTDLANGSYTVTPSNARYTFTPGSQTVTINGAHAMNVELHFCRATYSLCGTISGPRRSRSDGQPERCLQRDNNR